MGEQGWNPIWLNFSTQLLAFAYFSSFWNENIKRNLVFIVCINSRHWWASSVQQIFIEHLLFSKQCCTFWGYMNEWHIHTFKMLTVSGERHSWTHIYKTWYASLLRAQALAYVWVWVLVLLLTSCVTSGSFLHNMCPSFVISSIVSWWYPSFSIIMGIR